MSDMLLTKEERTAAKADAVLSWIGTKESYLSPRDIGEFIASNKARDLADEFIAKAQEAKTRKRIAEDLVELGLLVEAGDNLLFADTQGWLEALEKLRKGESLRGEE